MDKHHFFFCYNKDLSTYLRNRGFRYIFKAQHPKSKKIFSLYYKDSQLQKALEEYKKPN